MFSINKCNFSVSYDGLYKIVKYWPEKSEEGFVIWRYLFRRDDPTPAPWTPEGKRLILENGYMCIYPDNYEEAQAAKKRKKPGDESTESGAKKCKLTRTFKVPENLSKLIKEDRVNTKLWEELLSKPMGTKLDFTNLVEEFFNCLICMDVISDPVSTACGHNLCYGCLRRLVRSDAPDCPACRTKLKEQDNKRNTELRDALRAILPGEIIVFYFS